MVCRITSLSRFIAQSAKKSLPFFKKFRKTPKFVWTEDCDEAFKQLTIYLTSPPLLSKLKDNEMLYLYLVVTYYVGKDKDGTHLPIYYVSNVLSGPELNYLDIEKFAYALVHTARKLRPYFQSHRVTILTNQPLKQIVMKPETSERLVKWAVELGEYGLESQPKTIIKAQRLVDFVVEIVSEGVGMTSEPLKVITTEGLASRTLEELWILHVDGSSTNSGGGIGIYLCPSDGWEFEYVVCLNFPVTNNQAEYKALLAGIQMAKSPKITKIDAFSDSQLITNQFVGKFEAKKEAITAHPLSGAQSLGDLVLLLS